MNYLCKLLLLWSRLCCLLATPAQVQEAGHGQAALHHHPPQDHLLHEKVYSTWHMPDNPSVSCCNEADCYPTEVKYVDGELYAKRREDGKYIPVPPQKVERNRDNPDGRNHLCHMRFVLVNGRTPCQQSFCVLCCEPIGASYLRELGTRLSYCDHNCYADHCKKRQGSRKSCKSIMNFSCRP